MSNIRSIAFYLPQFYPTLENDEWWETGFTEWTNVARAEPLFRGHYQPRIPRDLGFYDLRVPETREKQVLLAREAGIEGFCYWHYWFGIGKRLLADVFREVVETGKPDFPFCLCWANHSWFQKTWDPTKPDKLLIEQTYSGVEDYKAHFMEMLSAFKDDRYMKTSDGRLIFGVFEPNFKDAEIFINTWNQLATENGLKGFYFFALIKGEKMLKSFNKGKYNAIVYDTLVDTARAYLNNKFQSKVVSFKRKYLNKPYVRSYDDYSKESLALYEKYSSCIPCLNPDFDHTPRSQAGGIVLHKSTPAKWKELVSKTITLIEKSTNSEKLLFIKAWNEWAEGNYLEPDRKNGLGYIKALKAALSK